MAAKPSGFAGDLQSLKLQMQDLGAGIAPAAARVVGDVAPPLHKLIGYAELAMTVLPEVRELAGRWRNWRGQAAAAAAARVPRVGPHPLLTGGVVAGVGLAVFILFRSRPAAQTRNPA